MANRGTAPEAHADGRGEERAGETPPTGALAELIRVEERVRAAIRGAETEAARAIAAAEAEAGECSNAQDQALDTALRALEKGIEAERAAAIAEAAGRSDEAVRQLSEVDEARIGRLADLVARRVAEGEPASEESTP